MAGFNSSSYPQALETLIHALRRLPGVGGRTAERFALALMEWKTEDLAHLGELVSTLHSRLSLCQRCGNLADGERCRICADLTRNTQVVCVVEQPGQIPVFERSGSFRGVYHVLGGRIQPLDGKGPADLRIEELRQRLEAGGIKELILATSSDVEGEATATYLAQEFAGTGVAISRIAAGVPVGADLGYADAATIAVAMNARRSLVRPPQ